MSHDLDEALKYLLEEEGGWSDHPSDRGGKTMYGVTQSTYSLWLQKHKQQARSVSTITKIEARQLYKENYWDAAGCDRLPWPVSYVVFDGAVNSGVSRSVKWLQASLGKTQDGVVGQQTVSAAKALVDAGDSKGLLDLVDQRVSFLVSLVKSSPNQSVFLLGWWRRTLRVLARALLSELDS